MLLALHTNIRLGWEGLPGTNTLAYYKILLYSFNNQRNFIDMIDVTNNYNSVFLNVTFTMTTLGNPTIVRIG